MIESLALGWGDIPALTTLALPAFGAMVVLLLATAGGPSRPLSRHQGHFVGVTLATLAATAYALLVSGPMAGQPTLTLSGGSVVLDGLAQSFGLSVLLAAAIGTLAAASYLAEHKLALGEYYALLLLATCGALITALAGNLLLLFLGIELMSLSVYVLAGYRRAHKRSQEAALKYFLFGAIAASLLIMGIALVWGEVGRAGGQASMSLANVHAVMLRGTLSPMGWVGLALVVSGLGYKIAAVPFHMWAPDVYEGAPTPAAGYLSTGVKVAGTAALLRFLAATLACGRPSTETAVQVIEVFAIGSMVLGNLLAARQSQLKRLLGYSSIAHIGYVLVGIAGVVANPRGEGASAVAFYLLGYVVMGSLAFAVASAFECRDDRRVDLPLERLTGAGRSHPGLGISMAAALFGLAGIPPTVGFVGKLGLFSAALAAGRTSVVLIAALCSVVGAYAYLRVLVVMFMRSGAVDETYVQSAYLTWTLWLCTGATVGLGLMPWGPLELLSYALHGWPA